MRQLIISTTQPKAWGNMPDVPLYLCRDLDLKQLDIIRDAMPFLPRIIGFIFDTKMVAQKLYYQSVL